jgi:hypothetical protein
MIPTDVSFREGIRSLLKVISMTEYFTVESITGLLSLQTQRNRIDCLGISSPTVATLNCLGLTAGIPYFLNLQP